MWVSSVTARSNFSYHHECPNLKPKTPIDASACGKLLTLSARTLPACIAFVRDDWWFGRIVLYRIYTAPFENGGPKIPKIRKALGSISMSFFEAQEGH